MMQKAQLKVAEHSARLRRRNIVLGKRFAPKHFRQSRHSHERNHKGDEIAPNGLRRSECNHLAFV
jgi:hypothetical protein